jgi:mycothiol synthase
VSATHSTRWLDLAGAPSIPGLRLRSFTDASDYERLSDLLIAASTFDAVPWFPTAENVRLDIGEVDGIDPAEDIVLVELDDRVIATSGVQRVVREGVPTYEVWGAVDPSFRRRGLGSWLLGLTLHRVRVRVAREDPATEVSLGSFAEATEIALVALLEANGFTPVRHFFVMRRDLRDSIPNAPLPDGFAIRPVTPDQYRAIFVAEDEAFRDHWGHRRASESDYRATYGRTELDADLWVVAWAGDEVAGVVQNWVWPEENARLGVRRGWLEHISVRRPWRRRGLARAITAASLVKLREAGLDEAMLGVDSENQQGALGLYEGLGFTIHSRAAAYRRPLVR